MEIWQNLEKKRSTYYDFPTPFYVAENKNYVCNSHIHASFSNSEKKLGQDSVNESDDCLY